MNEFPWEDGLLERKTEGYDDEAFLKTMVGFANSVRPDHTAIILVGERDNGKVVGIIDPDKFQMRLHKIAKQIYPAILWRSQVYEKDGKNCIRIEIEYSGETPHFGGIAWIRKGSETIKATDEVFQRLIDLRLSKIRELGKWIGKQITLSADESDIMNYKMLKKNSTRMSLEIEPDWYFPSSVKLIFVNQFWITIESNDSNHSYSLEKISLSFDNIKSQLHIVVRK